MKHKNIIITFIITILVLLCINFYSFSLANKNFDIQITTLEQNLINHLKSYLHRRNVYIKLISTINKDEISISLDKDSQRETFLSIKTTFSNDKIKLEGKTLSLDEKKLIETHFVNLKPNIVSTISFHPYFPDIKKTYGIVKTSYANLYVTSNLAMGDNLASQILMGAGVKLLEYSSDSKFARVQCEDDKYIAWIERSKLIELDIQKWNNWNKLKKVIITNNIKAKYPLYVSTILPLEKYSGNNIFLKIPSNEVLQLNKNDVKEIFKGTREDIIKTAKRFSPNQPLGPITYLWGGTKGKELDCSGFVQTVFRLNGYFLPRDADQQQEYSKPIALTISQINELQPGDLVFFSGNKEYATHIGIYIGNNQFIHSSPKGAYSGVKINSFSSNGSYDIYLRNIYFGGGKIL